MGDSAAAHQTGIALAARSFRLSSIERCANRENDMSAGLPIRMARTRFTD
jgi:hypothetical protein